MLIIFTYRLYLNFNLTVIIMFTGATVMDTQILVKSVGGTLIVPVAVKGRYRGTAVKTVHQAHSRKSFFATTCVTVVTSELTEVLQSAKVYVYQRPYSSS